MAVAKRGWEPLTSKRGWEPIYNKRGWEPLLLKRAPESERDPIELKRGWDPVSLKRGWNPVDFKRWWEPTKEAITRRGWEPLDGKRGWEPVVHCMCCRKRVYSSCCASCLSRGRMSKRVYSRYLWRQACVLENILSFCGKRVWDPPHVVHPHWNSNSKICKSIWHIEP